MTDKSVGLVVMTDAPGTGLVAVLRERGFLHPKTMIPESYPGVCQVTAHGRLEEGEDFLTALLRELTEELGNEFAFDVAVLLATKSLIFGEVSHFQGYDKEIITFAVKVDFSLLRKIRLTPESGAMRLVSLDETTKIVGVTPFDKINGVQDRRTIAMFPDEKKAVISAFSFVCSQ